MKQAHFVMIIALALAAPLQTAHAQRQFVSDFNDGVPDWNNTFSEVPPVATETNGQLRVRATFPATVGLLKNSVTFVEWRPERQPIRDGQTLEYRVDLVRASDANVLAGIYYHSGPSLGGTGQGVYAFLKDRNQVLLAKAYGANLPSPEGAVALLFRESASTRQDNVVLSLALTGVGDSVRITTRVLDKRRREAILFEKTVIDTPGADATVEAPWGSAADPGGPHLWGRGYGLYLAQFTDGNQPEAEVVYDNFTYEYRPPDPFTRITSGEIVTDTGNSGARGFNGASWGDFDDDGFVDLFVTRVPPNPNILYRNQRDGTFAKLPNESIAHLDVTSATGIWGDINNDGHIDLFVPNATVPGYERSPRDLLYRNNGDRTFTRVTAGDPVKESVCSADASWVDYDNDGFLDLFVANCGQRNFLYHNQGDGTFSRITQGNPVVLDAHYSHACSWADYDNDGDLDLFVPNKNANNYLYRNDGNGSFFKVTRENPLVIGGGNSEGSAWADYDNDGDLDLLVLNFPPEQNWFFRNDPGVFQRITNAPFLSAGGYGADWADYDNDGHLDLIIVRSFQSSRGSLLYRNQGDGTFVEIMSNTFSHDQAEAAAWGDYNNDGFPDLFLTISQRNRLYHNSTNQNNWIKVKLVGSVSNRSAIGAKVRVKATIAGKISWQMREISTPGGFGKSDLRPNFGLGDATLAETIRIEWPSGTIQELHNVPAKQMITVVEPPRLLAEGFSGGQFQMRAIGAAGLRYRLESSINLRDWTPSLTLVHINRSMSLSLDGASNSRTQFYRLVQEE